LPRRGPTSQAIVIAALWQQGALQVATARANLLIFLSPGAFQKHPGFF
jgi:hypothetical protein